MIFFNDHVSTFKQLTIFLAYPRNLIFYQIVLIHQNTNYVITFTHPLIAII